MPSIDSVKAMENGLEEERRRYAAAIRDIEDDVSHMRGTPLTVRAALADARREHYDRVAALRLGVEERMQLLEN